MSISPGVTQLVSSSAGTRALEAQWQWLRYCCRRGGRGQARWGSGAGGLGGPGGPRDGPALVPSLAQACALAHQRS